MPAPPAGITGRQPCSQVAASVSCFVSAPPVSSSPMRRSIQIAARSLAAPSVNPSWSCSRTRLHPSVARVHRAEPLRESRGIQRGRASKRLRCRANFQDSALAAQESADVINERQALRASQVRVRIQHHRQGRKLPHVEQRGEPPEVSHGSSIPGISVMTSCMKPERSPRIARGAMTRTVASQLATGRARETRASRSHNPDEGAFRPANACGRSLRQDDEKRGRERHGRCERDRQAKSHARTGARK